MKLKLYKVLPFIVLLWICPNYGQNVSLYQQFNGRYDFTFIGNTLNPEENSFQAFPTIYTSSSATLSLGNNDLIEKAYLYWAGSGTGDYEVKLNNITLFPDRTFSHQRTVSGMTLDYFSAFKDVTTLVQQTGNGLYTLSDLDVSDFIDLHFLRRTNFAGWAIIVVYKNNNLPLNQINVYDGLQAVPNEINITLNSLNVIDNQDAKIGFLAWEGDVGIAVNETLRINGTILSNPPLNPANNAFNGTNSVTGSNTLYNMDLDIYNIQNNINIGDTSAQIQMTSGQDFVMINAIVTKLNSQLPDATVTINNIQQNCDSKTILVNYTVSNFNATNPLPAGTPIAIYANGILIQMTATDVIIPINGSVAYQISIELPNAVNNEYEIKFSVDDNGDGHGIVTELIEDNNTDIKIVTLWSSPTFNILLDLVSCNQGFGKGIFDFSDYFYLVKTNPTDNVSFYETSENATNGVNPIISTSNFLANTTPKEIFVRIENDHCFSITSFLLTTKNCPPTVYNFVSANNDGFNDTFHIAGLHNIFLNFKLEIYNRWGRLIWTGNNNTDEWNGFVKNGIGNDTAPNGTYYYLLYLNDPDYPETISGYLFLTK